MKLVDAPLPGWYPDPEGGSLLRWWEGTDWTDKRCPAPSAFRRAEMEAAAARQVETGSAAKPRSARAMARAESEDIATQVREATRQEIDRAAREISQGVQASIARIRPAIIGYVSQILRWVRIGVVTAAILVVVWFTIQFIAQATFLQWLGDRIDNLTD